MDKKITVLFVDEKTAIQSIVSDVFSFGCFLGSAWVNYKYLGNSVVFQVFIVIAFLIIVHSRVDKKITRMSPQEALEYLKNNLQQDMG